MLIILHNIKLKKINIASWVIKNTSAAAAAAAGSRGGVVMQTNIQSALGC